MTAARVPLQSVAVVLITAAVAVLLECGITLFIEFALNRWTVDLGVYRHVPSGPSSALPCLVFPLLLLSALIGAIASANRNLAVVLGLLASIPISALLMLEFIRHTGGWN